MPLPHETGRQAPPLHVPATPSTWQASPSLAVAQAAAAAGVAQPPAVHTSLGGQSRSPHGTRPGDTQPTHTRPISRHTHPASHVGTLSSFESGVSAPRLRNWI